MKKATYLFLFSLFFVPGFSQNFLFEKITEGPHVTTPGDSRSVNFTDVNNDGWEDLFITNGPENGAANFLYLNDGAGGFTAVTSGDIVSHAKPFDGATFGDFDNDGDLDAFAVTWYGVKNYLYSGNGDGTFTYLPDAAPSVPGTFSETASWGDYDLDGDLDLYETNSGGDKKNQLYRNDFLPGGTPGSFTKITTGGPHVTDADGSRSVNWVDFDNDCDPDLYVSNEANTPDDLYRNEGGGVFVKVTTGAPGTSNRSSMSSSWGDVDNDGDLDLFVANSDFFAAQNNELFLNHGDGTFQAVNSGDLVTDGGCSYGSNFGDYDNDGDLDLVVANGYCNGQILNFLYRNDHIPPPGGTQGGFTRDLESIGDLSTPCSYGVAWGDVNNDGSLDLAFATCQNSSASPLPPDLFYLNNGNNNNWLKIRLEGSLSNRSAIGAKAWVKATIGGQEVTQMREISAQSGYCGQNSLLVHFGLGDATSVTELRVQFGCGQDTTLTNVPVNQLLEITEALPVPATEVPENEGLSLEVSPNPASDTFRVAVAFLRQAGQFQLRMTDSAGRVVFEKNGLDGEQSWEGEFSVKGLGLVAGVYSIVVEVGGISVVRQVVVGN